MDEGQMRLDVLFEVAKKQLQARLKKYEDEIELLEKKYGTGKKLEYFETCFMELNQAGGIFLQLVDIARKEPLYTIEAVERKQKKG